MNNIRLQIAEMIQNIIKKSVLIEESINDILIN